MSIRNEGTDIDDIRIYAVVLTEEQVMAITSL